jgi:methyl-accepting chemotaxis protein
MGFNFSIYFTLPALKKRVLIISFPVAQKKALLLKKIQKLIKLRKQGKMKRTPNRRQLKNYLIANKIHFKLMLANLILLLLVVAVIIGSVLFPFYHEIFKIDDIYAQNYSAKFFIVLLERLSFALVVVFIISLIYQMIINHKFCGPLVNFSNTFQKISQGDLTRKIYLRRYDFLKNEAAQVNNMIDFLSDHIMTFKKNHSRLISTLNEVSGIEMEQAEYKETIEIIRKQADICHNHLSIFKIDGKHDRDIEQGSDM